MAGSRAGSYRVDQKRPWIQPLPQRAAFSTLDIYRIVCIPEFLLGNWIGLSKQQQLLQGDDGLYRHLLASPQRIGCLLYVQCESDVYPGIQPLFRQLRHLLHNSDRHERCFYDCSCFIRVIFRTNIKLSIDSSIGVFFTRAGLFAQFCLGF